MSSAPFAIGFMLDNHGRYQKSAKEKNGTMTNFRRVISRMFGGSAPSALPVMPRNMVAISKAGM